MGFKGVFLIPFLIIAFVSESFAQQVSPTTGCAPLKNVQFIAPANSTGIYWDFDDQGTGSVLDTAYHTFTTAGVFKIKFTATVNGLPVTKFFTVTVFGNPVAKFKADDTSGCRPLTVNFTDLSISSSAIVKWEWTFGD